MAGPLTDLQGLGLAWARFAPTLANGETYQQTREDIGGDTMPEICPSTIPVQSFLIE